MKILYTIMLGLFLAMPELSEAQVYTNRMDDAISRGDTALQRRVLREWKFEWPEDPDFMLAEASFYQRKHRLQHDSLASPDYLDSARNRLDTAVRSFPDRLDIRLAYISLLGEMEEYEQYAGQLVALLDAHDGLGDDWLWKNNNKLVGVNEFVLQYIDMYTLMLYNTKNDDLYPLMDTVSARLLQSYPRHIPALLSLSINALHGEQYETAIGYLHQAREIAPENTSVLDNLGMAYERTGDRERARECYEQIQKHGTEQEKEFASRKLEELARNP